MLVENRMVVICGEKKNWRRAQEGFTREMYTLGNVFLHLGASYKGRWLLGENLPRCTLMMCGFCIYILQVFKKAYQNWL